MSGPAKARHKQEFNPGGAAINGWSISQLLLLEHACMWQDMDWILVNSCVWLDRRAAHLVESDHLSGLVQ